MCLSLGLRTTGVACHGGCHCCCWHRVAAVCTLHCWTVAARAVALTVAFTVAALHRVGCLLSQYSVGHCGCTAQFALWLRVTVLTVY